jgi:hypothetical protein
MLELGVLVEVLELLTRQAVDLVLHYLRRSTSI